jgi:hypothetical protein
VPATAATLLDRSPLQLHSMLSTRAGPPLPLSRLRVRRDLAELRAEDLRFSVGEAGLADTAEGWRSWSAIHQTYEGPWCDLVHHSGRGPQALTFQTRRLDPDHPRVPAVTYQVRSGRRPGSRTAPATREGRVQHASGVRV